MLIKNKKYKNFILLTFLLFALLFVFEILPVYSDLLSMTMKVFEQNSQIEKIAENKNELDNLNKQIRKLKIRMYNNFSDYSDSRNLSAVINLLDSLSKKSKIKNIAIKPGELKENDQLWLQPVEISLESDYENIYNYVRFLENSSRIIKMKELKFKPMKTGLSILKLKANIEVYLNL